MAPSPTPLSGINLNGSMTNSFDGSMTGSLTGSLPGQHKWVVTPAEKAQYDAQFAAADTDRDGFVSGPEIKHMFLESGLPQQTLAHIWALCDMEGVGKLSCEQFALAMWLVQRARRGDPPPAALAPDMLPPAPCHTTKIEPAISLGPQPTAEMEAIAREVDALARERCALEAELDSKQRELNVKTGEADSLQSELDTLTATLKQLENQKGEAQKRLNDLKTQVEKLRAAAAAQQAAAAETEAEVGSRLAAARALQERAGELEAEAGAAAAAAAALTAHHARAVLALSQANLKISHLEEHHRLVSEAVAALGAGGAVPAACLTLTPQHRAPHLERALQLDHEEDEPFAKSNGFVQGGGFDADPFKDAAFSASSNDPFAPAHGHVTATQDGFASDPFASNSDPFAGDAFGQQANTTKPNDDGAWASDPFAVLHAPERVAGGGGAGGGSPTPALPPKRHKTPPPRPAPPRPTAPHKTAMDFADDPFKDYRYEDPFYIEDPFADVTNPHPARSDPFGRPTSVAGFETEDLFASPTTVNGGFAAPERGSGRVSAPPLASDPFARPAHPAHPAPPNNNDAWAAWPDDTWPASNASATSTEWKTDNWPNKTDNWAHKTDNWANKADNWANKTENWAIDWDTDQNKNLNEMWPSNTLPTKKEKSPRPVKYAKSLVHTIGGIGRSKQKDKKAKNPTVESKSSEFLPTEAQQWAWAAAESKRLEAEADARRRQEDAELQLALAISKQEK